MKERLDQALVAMGLVESRAKAQQLIAKGYVSVNGAIAGKSSQRVEESDSISVTQGLQYVSRGGEKLEAALKAFGLPNLGGYVCCDIGSSTGGFTDCLLQLAASKVYAIDSGTDCMHPLLRDDPRIVLMENTNVRTVEQLPEPVDLVVIDVSFIPLRLVLSPAVNFLKPDGEIIALVKPQFEAGKAFLPRDGVVKDPAIHRRILFQLAGELSLFNLGILGLIISPIIGGDGNREFLIHLKPHEAGLPAEDAIEGVFQSQ